MARRERHRLIAECPDRPALLHITNRGADHRDIFRSPVDRLVFLSILALAFVENGIRLHCFCLMTNHFHLLVEDPRGVISLAMLRLQSSYARYFNDSRGRRGAGHLFGDRFFSEEITSVRFYDQLTSYILLNPRRCATPLVADPIDYPWSSAALHLTDTSPSAHFGRLIQHLGGLDAIIESLPKLTRPEFERVRRARFEALLAGEWIAPEAARCGRSPEQMRRVLERRHQRAASTPSSGGIIDAQRALDIRAALDTDDNEEPTEGRALEAPQVTEHHAGLPLESVLEPILHVCGCELVDDHPSRGDVIYYELWRFTSAASEALARWLGVGAEMVDGAVERVRALRRRTLQWDPLLKRLEWRLRFALRYAPWRT